MQLCIPADPGEAAGMQVWAKNDVDPGEAAGMQVWAKNDIDPGEAAGVHMSILFFF